jgi:hypothetical protein
MAKKHAVTFQAKKPTRRRSRRHPQAHTKRLNKTNRREDNNANGKLH